MEAALPDLLRCETVLAWAMTNKWYFNHPSLEARLTDQAFGEQHDRDAAERWEQVVADFEASAEAAPSDSPSCRALSDFSIDSDRHMNPRYPSTSDSE